MVIKRTENKKRFLDVKIHKSNIIALTNVSFKCTISTPYQGEYYGMEKEADYKESRAYIRDNFHNVDTWDFVNNQPCNEYYLVIFKESFLKSTLNDFFNFS